jgi:hypothetical protein
MRWYSCNWTPSVPHRSSRSTLGRQSTQDNFQAFQSHRSYLRRSDRSILRTRRLEERICHSKTTASSTVESDVAYQLVARLLEKVEGTDRGADASEEVQNEVQAFLEKLEDLGNAQVKGDSRNVRPLFSMQESLQIKCMLV